MKSLRIVQPMLRHGKRDLCRSSSHLRMIYSFEFRTELRVIESANIDSRNRLIDLGENVFRCRLQVLSIATGVATRAKLIKSSTIDAGKIYEWDCGRGANLNPQIETHRAYIPVYYFST